MPTTLDNHRERLFNAYHQNISWRESSKMSSGPLSAPSSPADALAPHQNVQQGLPELRELPPATTLKFHREHPLFDDLAPEEGYNHEGVYWASSSRARVSLFRLMTVY
jgi:hypothetical protein